MGSKPQSQTTTNSTSSFSPPPDVLQNYRDVTQQAKNVAATPYTPYTGELVSSTNNQEQTGINAVNGEEGSLNGYNRGAVQSSILGGRAVTPTDYGQANVNQYLSPYINDVVKATEGQIQNQNQQQSSALTGNAISSGAFGGDRSGVAQAALAGQQDIASNQAIAGLYNQGFLNAQGEFNTQQAAKIGTQENTAARRLAEGQQFGALGQQRQNEGLTQAGAQLQAGELEQRNQQAVDTANYNQYLQKQAYPFQTTGWLANIVEGIGSQSGGTSTGSSDQTQSSSGLSSILGGGLGLLSFLNRGGRVGRRHGGVVQRRAMGGGLGAYMDSDSPVQTSLDSSGALGGGSWVVPANLPIGHTMPGSSGAPQGGGGGSSGGSNQMGSQLLSKGLGMFENSSMGDAFNDFTQDNFGFARGGGVVPFRRKRFDDGGFVDDALSVGPDGLLTAGDISTPAALSSPESVAASNAVVPSEWNAPQALPDIAKSGIVPIQTTTGGLAVTTPHVDPTNDNGAYGIVSPLNPPLPPVRPVEGGDHTDGVPDAYEPNPIPGKSYRPSLVPPGTVFGQAAPEAGGAPLGGIAPTPTAAVLADNAVGQANIDNGTVARGARAAGVAPTATGSGLASDAAAFGVDPTFNRMIGIESKGQQFNSDGSVLTSPKGALGIAQVMPGTGPEAAGYAGLAWDPKRLATDPAYNLALGKAYYQHQLETFGSPDKAAAAYNAGPAATQSAIDKAHQTGGSYLQYLPKETQAYVARATTGEVPALDAITAAAPSHGHGVSQSAATAPASHGVLGGLRNFLWGDSGQSGDTMHNPVENAVGNQTSGKAGLLGLNMSDSTRLGLLAAGLGTMGGTSMNPWTNLGQGGLKGLQTAMSAQGLNSEIGLRGAQTANQQAEAIQHMTEAQKSQYMLGNMQKFFEGLQKKQAEAAKTSEPGGPPVGAPAAPAATAPVAAPPPPSPAAPTSAPAPIAPVGAPIAPAAAAAPAPASNDPWAGWRVPDDQNPVALRQQAAAALANAKAASMGGMNDVASKYQEDAQQKLLQAHQIQTTGDVTYPDGKGGTINGKYPGWVPRQAQIEAATEAAKSQAGVPAGVGRAMAEKDIEGAHTAAAASQATLYRLKEMDQQIKNLPASGSFAPGSPGIATYVGIARGINALTGKNFFDPNQIASIEETMKDKFRLGAELSRQVGGREPGYIVEQAVEANPGVENSKAGYQRIVSGLRQSALYNNDYATFVDGYFAQHGTTVGAPQAFQATHPVQAYIERALASTVDPRDAAALANNMKNPEVAAKIDKIYGKGTAELLVKRGFDTSDGTQQ